MLNAYLFWEVMAFMAIISFYLGPMSGTIFPSPLFQRVLLKSTD
ncbi:MAG: hypothetical protein PHY93_18305 [Bacteriovorax sp.]|nr:hypothetical protein [Bacteriovorax sp.]